MRSFFTVFLVVGAVIGTALALGCGTKISTSSSADIVVTAEEFDGLRASESYSAIVKIGAYNKGLVGGDNIQIRKTRLTIDVYLLGDDRSIQTYVFEMNDAAITEKDDGVYLVTANERSRPELKLIGPVKLSYHDSSQDDQISFSADLSLALALAETPGAGAKYRRVAKISIAYSGEF